MPLDIKALAEFAEHLTRISRGMLEPVLGARPDAELKPDKSFVTALDKAIEQRLRREITARHPDHGIMGEEEGHERPEAAIQWILDPIDGTAAFIAGIPVFGTLVALAVEATPVIGVIDLPSTRDHWLGVAGQPTFRNGAACHTRACTRLEDAILSTSNPDFYAPHELPVLEKLKPLTRWRVYGGSAMSYGLLASGRIDVSVDTRLAVHDFAGFRPIIEGAGGVITDWQGNPVTITSGPRILAAGDPARHAEALAHIKGMC